MKIQFRMRDLNANANLGASVEKQLERLNDPIPGLKSTRSIL